MRTMQAYIITCYYIITLLLMYIFSGQIHIRGDMSDALPFGTRWEQLDMVQLNKVVTMVTVTGPYIILMTF